MRSIRLRLVLLTTFVWALAPTPSLAETTVSAEADAARPFVVKVHADWCGTCRALDGTWSELEARLGDGARFVILDVTDQATLVASDAEARRLGLEGFFAEYKARTGTIAVLHGESRAKVEVLKGVRDLAPYEAAVAEARGTDPS